VAPFAGPSELADATSLALETYHDEAAMRALVDSGMARDSSWARSAEAYLGMYREIVR
jgi:glycogen synthase